MSNEETYQGMDDLFEDDFLGDWTQLPAEKFPSPEKLPPAAYPIISRRLGLDMTSEDVLTHEKIAANEWFWRNLRGQRVTFRQVLRGGSIANVIEDKKSAEDETFDAADLDPTPPEPVAKKTRANG